MRFVMCRDNGAQLQCSPVGDDGVELAMSATFGFAGAARGAACEVHLTAGSAEGTEAGG